MTGPVRARRRRSSSRFGAALALVTLLALAIRVAFVLLVRHDVVPGGDARFYHEGANLLADGRGFVSPYDLDRGLTMPAAEHPPLYVVYLAIPSWFGLTGPVAHMVWSCIVGSVTVTVVGLVGRIVAGARAGILAAAIAAVYPNLWAPDGMLQAETLSTFATVLAVYFAYRCWRDPTPAWFVAVGATCGAGALARSELLLLLPLLVVPLAWMAGSGPVRTRILRASAAVLAGLVVVAPWVVYNATRFEHPVLMSTQIDPLLASANCDSVYNNRDLAGYFDIGCAITIAEREGIRPTDDQSEAGEVYRAEAFDYIGAHLGDVPGVVVIRLLRIAGLYRPAHYARVDMLIEGRERWVSWAALWSFYAIALLAVAGAVIVRRRRAVPLFPLVAPVVMVIVTVVVTYASTRFRAAAEPALVVLAAVTLDACLRRPSPTSGARGSGRRSAARAPSRMPAG